MLNPSPARISVKDGHGSDNKVFSITGLNFIQISKALSFSDDDVFTSMPLARNQEFFAKKMDCLSYDGKLLIERLDSIMGITYLHIYPYKVEVSKADAYEWEELMPHIMEAIAELYRRNTIFEVKAQNTSGEKVRWNTGRVGMSLKPMLA